MSTTVILTKELQYIISGYNIIIIFYIINSYNFFSGDDVCLTSTFVTYVSKDIILSQVYHADDNLIYLISGPFICGVQIFVDLSRVML